MAPGLLGISAAVCYFAGAGVVANAPVIDVAEAVKEMINAATLSQDPTAERKVYPYYELKDIEALVVLVAPNHALSTILNRAGVVRTAVVEVGVLKQIDVNDNDTTDPLFLYVSELAGLFHGNELTGFAATCTKVEHEPIYDWEHMKQFGQFTSVLRLTCKVTG